MRNVTNKFGSGELFSPADLNGTVYITCAACLSIYAETLGWANKHKDMIVKTPEEADNIIVLSCQVTDLAISNDIYILDQLVRRFENNENVKIFVGGCLAQRFDIDLSNVGDIARMDHMRADYEFISDRTLVNFEDPFWTTISNNDDEFDDGNLFRYMYPLRIGVGCHGKCKYCTIRTTRGIAYDLDPLKLEDEFKSHDDIVLVADSITPYQIRVFADMAMNYQKKISIRNVEPHNVIATSYELLTLAKNNLLKVLHTPVQAYSREVLEDMNRSKEDVDSVLQIIRDLKDMGVFTATNIIVDYKNFSDDFDVIDEVFDYVSWNPYWDGKFDDMVAFDKELLYF